MKLETENESENGVPKRVKTEHLSGRLRRTKKGENGVHNEARTDNQRGGERSTEVLAEALDRVDLGVMGEREGVGHLHNEPASGMCGLRSMGQRHGFAGANGPVYDQPLEGCGFRGD